MNNTPNYGINLNICGADAIDRELNRVEERTNCNASAIANRYTKDEVNLMLAGKADRCAFEKHVLECGHGKPGHKPPHHCKPGCNCDCYTKDEIDELLENKVNTGYSQVYDLELLEGFSPGQNDGSGRSIYWKNSSGEVTVSFVVKYNQELPLGGVRIALLPEGFRPLLPITRACGFSSTPTALFELSVTDERAPKSLCKSE